MTVLLCKIWCTSLCVLQVGLHRRGWDTKERPPSQQLCEVYAGLRTLHTGWRRTEKWVLTDRQTVGGVGWCGVEMRAVKWPPGRTTVVPSALCSAELLLYENPLRNIQIFCPVIKRSSVKKMRVKADKFHYINNWEAGSYFVRQLVSIQKFYNLHTLRRHFKNQSVNVV